MKQPLLRVVVHQGLRKGLVGGETLPDSFLAVIRTLDQCAAVHVTSFILPGRAEVHVVNPPADGTHSPAGKTPSEAVSTNANVNHQWIATAVFSQQASQELSLPDGPGKTVKNEPTRGIRLPNALSRYATNHLVRNQLAALHARLGRKAKRASLPNRIPEHVTRRYLGNTELMGYGSRLRPFTRSGRPKKYQGLGLQLPHDARRPRTRPFFRKPS